MSHDLIRNSLTGEYELMTRGAAWHGLGTVVKEAQNWEDARRLAGLDWKIVKRQLEFHGEQVPAWGIFREDLLHHDASKAFLAPTSSTYELLQNDYIFAFLDALMESEGAFYESAGALNGGKQVFALINLNLAFEPAPDDRHENYICFTEDRTQRSRAKVFMTNTRVVCGNTYRMALGGADDSCSIGFRHTSNLGFKLQEAADAFTGARMSAKLLKEKLTALASRKVDTEMLKNALIPVFKTEDAKEGEVTAAMTRKILDVARLFEHNDGDRIPEIRGTAYNLFNAVTEYVDHFIPVRRSLLTAGTDDQIRFQRALFGEGAVTKETALEWILRTTEHAPKVLVPNRVSTVGANN